MASGLTEKQKRFADEYLIDLNATQAAIRAGYSKKTAGQIGEQNLKKLQIQGYIQSGREKLQNKLEITQEKVLSELAKIGFASITDYLEYKTDIRVIDHKADGKPIHDWAVLVNAKDSAEVDGSPIQEVSLSKDGTFKFKLYSKLDALEKLGRHLNLFGENQRPAWQDEEDDELFKSVAEAMRK